MTFHPGRLRQALALAEMTRADLARETGLPPWRLAHWDAEISAPRPYELERVAKALGQRVEFFATGRPFAQVDSAHVHTCALDEHGHPDWQRSRG